MIVLIAMSVKASTNGAAREPPRRTGAFAVALDVAFVAAGLTAASLWFRICCFVECGGNPILSK
jgi:hypothetical protein